ncbi:hypothetical protein VTL71DRAFT_1219 [Oculimacula yallundae]|uniref:Uncharacterized protein n=1 Tax=Oculimacula yallundae TaxID=86028 RepID=A0ABR4CA23_9HELO
MDTIEERSRQARGDQIVCVGMFYMFIFALFIWISTLLELPRNYIHAAGLAYLVLGIVIYAILKSRAHKRLQQIIYPPLLPRVNSYDSGYTSNYGSINESEIRIRITNEEGFQITNQDRFCQLCVLRTQERSLRSELAVLIKKAHEAYQKHLKVSQFICAHDGPKAAMVSTHWVSVNDTNAWYAADLERSKKDKELQIIVRKIQNLRDEMQEHFYDGV